MEMHKDYQSEIKSESQSYANIRKVIGYSGIAIPLLCLSLVFTSTCSGKILPSISHYYYSIIGDVFVGVLFSLGLFLMLYKSVFFASHLRKWENRLTNLAGLFACIVAFIPTNPEGGDCYFINLNSTSYQSQFGFWGHLHLPAAGLMLIIFGFLSYYFFPRNWKTGIADSENIKTYRLCGWVIFISIGVLLLFFLIKSNTSNATIDFLVRIRIVFLLESISIIFFAVSWLKKGRAIDSLFLAYEEAKRSFQSKGKEEQTDSK